MLVFAGFLCSSFYCPAVISASIVFVQLTSCQICQLFGKYLCKYLCQQRLSQYCVSLPHSWFDPLEIVAYLIEAKVESDETCWISSLSSYSKQEIQLRETLATFSLAHGPYRHIL